MRIDPWCIEKLKEYKSMSHIVPIEVRGDQFESGWIQGWTACSRWMVNDLFFHGIINPSYLDVSEIYQRKIDEMVDAMKKTLEEVDD